MSLEGTNDQPIEQGSDVSTAATPVEAVESDDVGAKMAEKSLPAVGADLHSADVLAASTITSDQFKSLSAEARPQSYLGELQRMAHATFEAFQTLPEHVSVGFYGLADILELKQENDKRWAASADEGDELAGKRLAQLVGQYTQDPVPGRDVKECFHYHIETLADSGSAGLADIKNLAATRVGQVEVPASSLDNTTTERMESFALNPDLPEVALEEDLRRGNVTPLAYERLARVAGNEAIDRAHEAGLGSRAVKYLCDESSFALVA